MCICITSLGINGMLLNGLVIRSFISNPILHAPYNLIVLNLIFAEIILSSLGLGMDFQTLIQNGWVLGNELCVVSGALVTTAAFASSATICALSVVRYGSIFHYGNFEENVPNVCWCYQCISALDTTWHPEHFLCSGCGKQLGKLLLCSLLLILCIHLFHKTN